MDYDGSDLKVFYTQSTTKPAGAQLTYPIDLNSELGADAAYVGFTGGTGGAAQRQVIKDFIFSTRVVASGAAGY